MHLSYGRVQKKPLPQQKSWVLTAARLKELGLIDNIVPEPLGGAHRNHHEMARNLKTLSC